MSKNELLLLLNEYFSTFEIELSEDQDFSILRTESGHEISQEYFEFVRMLLRLHGVSDALQ